MAAKNISKRRPAALIVYDRKFRSSSLREEQSAGMGGAPDTRGTKVRAVLLQPGDEFGERPDRQRFSGDNELRIACKQGYGRKILRKIIGQIVDRRIDDVSAPVAETERVPIRSGMRDVADPRASASSRMVLNDDALAEFDSEAIRHHARQRVEGPAGGKRDDDGDWP
jgi:hypothetical protein